MKCPLRSYSYKGVYDQDQYEDLDCLKEECAWWSEEHAQCDPTGLLPWFIHLESRFSELVDKMPHEEQFRR